MCITLSLLLAGKTIKPPGDIFLQIRIAMIKRGLVIWKFITLVLLFIALLVGGFAHMQCATTGYYNQYKDNETFSRCGAWGKWLDQACVRLDDIKKGTPKLDETTARNTVSLGIYAIWLLERCFLAVTCISAIISTIDLLISCFICFKKKEAHCKCCDWCHFFLQAVLLFLSSVIMLGITLAYDIAPRKIMKIAEEQIDKMAKDLGNGRLGRRGKSLNTDEDLKRWLRQSQEEYGIFERERQKFEMKLTAGSLVFVAFFFSIFTACKICCCSKITKDGKAAKKEDVSTKQKKAELLLTPVTPSTSDMSNANDTNLTSPTPSQAQLANWPDTSSTATTVPETNSSTIVSVVDEKVEKTAVSPSKMKKQRQIEKIQNI